MMTFVVVSDLVLNAQILDSVRLLKQAVEANQLIRTLITGKGWIHHPITLAWQGHLEGLKFYYNCILKEFITRGGKPKKLVLYEVEPDFTLPWWINWDRLHQSHRAMLFRK